MLLGIVQQLRPKKSGFEHPSKQKKRKTMKKAFHLIFFLKTVFSFSFFSFFILFFFFVFFRTSFPFKKLFLLFSFFDIFSKKTPLFQKLFFLIFLIVFLFFSEIYCKNCFLIFLPSVLKKFGFIFPKLYDFSFFFSHF